MQSLRRKIKELLEKNQNRDLLAVEAALYASMNAKVPFGVQHIVLIEFVSLIAEKLPEAAELLPFIKPAIDELSVAVFQRDMEKHDLGHTLILYRATIVSCEKMRAMMFSKDFMVAISLIPCACMPEYFDSVSAISTLTDRERLTSKFDAMTMERDVSAACMEICSVVQEVLGK
jgi:hypothetical protein